MTIRRKIALIGATVATLFVAGLLGLHFYLRASAARYRAELVRKGEKLEISELLPTPVNSDSNGAPALMAAVMQLPRGTTNEISPIGMKLVAPGRALVGWRQPDLRTRSSEQTNTWEELARQCRDSAAALDGVRSALQASEFDFNLNYLQGNSLPLPHLSRLKLAAQTLKASTMLHLHEQKLELVFKELQAQLALCAVQENEPIVISQLVRMSCMSLALNTTWEALQADGWSDAHLADLQRRWAKFRILQSCADSLVRGRATTLQAIERARESSGAYGSYFTMWPGSGSTAGDDPLETVVNGAREALGGAQEIVWRSFRSYIDERQYLATQQILIEASRRPASGRFGFPEQKRLGEALAQIGYREDYNETFWPNKETFYDLVSMLTAPLLKFNSRAFSAEAQRDLAIVAIAIKRYQVRHGRLPLALDSLAPEFLTEVPLDRMDGKPLRYRIEPTGGGFLLYSVGSDGVDDGGNGAKAEGESPTTPPQNWLSGKDWVWPQPANREEVEKYNATIGEEIRKRWEKHAKSKKQNAAGN